MNCGIGHRHGSDLALWLWCRLAATAPIRPLAWEPPYAMGVALEKTKKEKKKTKKIKYLILLEKIYKIHIYMHTRIYICVYIIYVDESAYMRIYEYI